jgi:hypothetical protein
MLEDDGFVPVGRVTFEPPARLVVQFLREDAKAWGPTLYAFRVGNEVVRLGKCESTLKGRMVETERLVSRALSGNFQKGGTNPCKAFEWRRRLIEYDRWKRGVLEARAASPQRPRIGNGSMRLSTASEI